MAASSPQGALRAPRGQTRRASDQGPYRVPDALSSKIHKVIHNRPNREAPGPLATPPVRGTRLEAAPGLAWLLSRIAARRLRGRSRCPGARWGQGDL